MIAAAAMRSRRHDEEMVPVLVRHKIQVLRGAGHSQADVASRTGVSLAAIRRIERESEVADIDDRGARRERGIGRPSKAQPFVDQVKQWLAEEPDTPTLELLRRAKLAGYEGHKSAFYALVAGVRPKQATPIVRFEGLPGEFSQHDFGEVDVRFIDGGRKRVHFFASRLKHSRFARVTVVRDQGTETLVRSLADHFVAFGGVPLLAVFDRPKTIVIQGGKGREVRQYNATFAQAMLELGVGVEICAPRSGNQKGSVERIVGWVKNSFFKVRRFVDMVDLQAQLDDWLLEVNARTPSRATGEIPETLRQKELARLRPLKVLPESLALRFPVVVGPTAEVLFEGARYSMPPDATHVAGTLYLYKDRVRIVAGRFCTEQRRRTAQEPYAPVPEHRAAKLAAVHGKRAKLYEKREQLARLGSRAVEFLTEAVHRRPKGMTDLVERLYKLLEDYGDDALRDALGDALARRQFSARDVQRLLRSPRAPERRSAARSATVADRRDASAAGRRAGAPRAPGRPEQLSLLRRADRKDGGS